MALRARSVDSIPFDPFSIEMEFDDPTDAEHILQGLIVAQSNNSNPFFKELVEAINDNLTEWRAQKVLSDVAARGE